MRLKRLLDPCKVARRRVQMAMGLSFIKTFSDKLAPILLDMFNESLANGSLPQTLSQAVISLLLKKDKDPTECGSYRHLGLVTHLFHGLGCSTPPPWPASPQTLYAPRASHFPGERDRGARYLRYFLAWQLSPFL